MKEMGFLLNEVNDLPEPLRVTLNGQRFLQFDSGINSVSRYFNIF